MKMHSLIWAEGGVVFKKVVEATTVRGIYGE